MATKQIHDLFDGNTYYIYADSTEYFRMSLFNSETNEAIDLSTIDDIEWFIGSASVKNRYAEIEKSLLRDEIQILKDNANEFTNTIQVMLSSEDTKNFQGGYFHQIRITDGSGKIFRPMKGMLIFEGALLSKND